MLSVKPYPLILGLTVLFLLVRPTVAFGAGNIAGISKIEGQNWRHGDIEDALLKILMAKAATGKKFDKLSVSRTYFGNWLRDYSQAIDVGTVKSISAEAIRLLLCILGFLTFGYGSKEFEVTADRLGCYRPEEHIDNPKNYADNVDARQYDRRLRGPIDEEVELAIDPETGMKNYIANENVNIMTSARLVRHLFGRCVELGRSYGRNKKKADLYEALRLMGTGLHCLEDFLAHSNYTELALIELGEQDIFPHVGSRTAIRLRGARDHVYPIVTGTFGGVDFLHSVAGEVSDKLTQNEIDELEGTLQNSKNSDNSVLEDLLDKIPSGLFGDDDKKEKMHNIQDNASSAQVQQMSVSPREPEEYTQYIKQIFEQVMPAIEFHDDVMKSVSEAIEKIPVLPKIVEQLEEQLSRFVFSVMAPFVVPVIHQIKNELRTGSSEIIESSKNEQHIVFSDDHSSDPTHSMLSKDHFSNILNEIAGKTASKVVGWVVPQLMEAWDDDGVDIDRTLNRIVHGVLHHPAQRDMGEDGARDGRELMFRTVEHWWSEMDRRQQDEYRRKLSRDGVENGQNHKEGVHDTGHGCGKPLGMHKNFGGGGGNTMEDQIANAATGAILGGLSEGVSNFIGGSTGVNVPKYEQSQGEGRLDYGGRQESHHSGGGGGNDGGLGSIIGAVAGGVLGDSFKDKEKESYDSRRRQDDGGYTQSHTEYGRSGDRYGQAQYQQTEYPDGSERTEYRRYEQDEGQGRRHGDTSGYGYEERTETRPTYGGYEERTERRYESGSQSGGYGGGREERYESSGGYGGSSGGYGGGREERYESSGGYGGSTGGYGGGRDDRQESSGGYGGRQEGSHERRDDDDERREESGGGGLFGGGNILENIGRAAEDAFGDGRRRRSRDEGKGGWGF